MNKRPFFKYFPTVACVIGAAVVLAVVILVSERDSIDPNSFLGKLVKGTEKKLNALLDADVAEELVYRLYEHAPSDAVELVIPDGVTEIGWNAFKDCPDLESVVFPNSVNFIPDGAFSNHGKLRSVVLPIHATVGDRAFEVCMALESVTVNRKNRPVAPVWEEEGTLAFIGQNAFASCRALKRFEFPDGIRTIGEEAFIDCVGLESLLLPDSVTDIGESAFCQCESLKSLRLPDKVRVIGPWAFTGNAAMAEIRMPAGPVEIGERAFGECHALKHVKLPPLSSPVVPEYLFCHCLGLETVELPKGITAIGEGALNSCPELREITIPEGVGRIGDFVFGSCPKLEHVSLPASLGYIGNSAFSWCRALEEITIPEGVAEIGPYAFRGSPCEGSVRRQMEVRRAAVQPEGK